MEKTSTQSEKKRIDEYSGVTHDITHSFPFVIIHNDNAHTNLYTIHHVR